jgi:hypothetical protein
MVGRAPLAGPLFELPDPALAHRRPWVADDLVESPGHLVQREFVGQPPGLPGAAAASLNQVNRNAPNDLILIEPQRLKLQAQHGSVWLAAAFGVHAQVGPSVRLSGCPAVRLSGCPAVRLSGCPAVRDC